MIDQSHNIEGKIEPMILSVMNCQEAYAKSLIVPRKRLAEAQRAGNVLEAHRILMDTFRTDVRVLLEEVRNQLGVDPDPIAAYRKTGYEAKIASKRASKKTGSGYQ
jgi:L-rhamnose isomerase/sugar isomerase